MTRLTLPNSATATGSAALSKVHMTDLIHKVARSRDTNAFQELFLAFSPRIKAMLMRQGADPETAEEIVQETMLSVWRKAHLFVESKGSFSTWVFTIARNLRIDRLRRNVILQDLDAEVEETASDEESPHDALHREQQRVYVTAALQKLTPEQYEVIRLSYIDGLTHTEIAERINVPLGTVKSRMRLAYGKLKEQVGELE
jgi:RNA polymerase sigma-70 factor (ECF subfamily)